MQSCCEWEIKAALLRCLAAATCGVSFLNDGALPNSSLRRSPEASIESSPSLLCFIFTFAHLTTWLVLRVRVPVECNLVTEANMERDIRLRIHAYVPRFVLTNGQPNLPM